MHLRFITYAIVYMHGYKNHQKSTKPLKQINMSTEQ